MLTYLLGPLNDDASIIIGVTLDVHDFTTIQISGSSYHFLYKLTKVINIVNKLPLLASCFRNMFYPLPLCEDVFWEDDRLVLCFISSFIKV